jgi:hypothetical protein
MSQVPFPAQLSEKEAAQYLGISLSSIRRWRRSYTGPAHYRFGGVLRYGHASLDAFIAHINESRG